MADTREQDRSATALPAALLLAALFAYLWLVLDPGLLYYSHLVTTKFPAFTLGMPFARRLLVWPGGPVDYVTAALSQLFYYGWAGAAVVTALAGGLCLTLRWFVATMTGRPSRLVHFLPALLLLVAYGRYAHPLAESAAVLAGAVAACAYAHLRGRHGPGWFVPFFVISFGLYYAAGAGFMLFASMCAAYELARASKPLLALLWLAVGAAVPLVVGRHVLLVPVGVSYGRLFPFQRELPVLPEAMSAGVYGSYLLAPALSIGCRRWARRVLTWARARETGRLGRAVMRISGGRTRLAIETAAILLVGGLAAWLSFDPGSRAVLRLERAAHRRQWAEVLRRALEVPIERYSFGVSYEVNRALAQQGRLLEEMFAYPQHPWGLLPATGRLQRHGLATAWTVEKLGSILCDVGQLNEAEHALYRALEFLGPRPWIVRQLGVLEAAKGETLAARVLFGLLSRDLVAGRVGRRYLQRMASDPDLSHDPEVRRLRSLRVRSDSAGTTKYAYLLEDLLEANPHNRMAFEYLCALYLVTRDLDPLVRNMGRLDQVGYRQFPRFYEEALALYMEAGHPDLDLHGRTISWQTARRFAEFSAALSRYGGDMDAARRGLAAKYGRTYFYFYRFGMSGVEQ